MDRNALVAGLGCSQGFVVGVDALLAGILLRLKVILSLATKLHTLAKAMPTRLART